MSNRNIRRGDTRVFNPDDIVVRERQSGNRQAGNVSGGGYGRNGSGAYGQRVEQTRGQYSGNAGQYGNRAQAAGTRRVEAGNTLSPKQAKKQQKKLKKQRRHKKFWFGFKIFMLIALIAILAALVVIYFKFGDDLLKWKMEATDVVENSTADTFRASETSIIYASNKSMIAKLKGDKDSYYLSFDEIPQSVKDAMVVTEDRDFYKHEGVNFWSTAKAAVMLVESKLRHKDISRGGSTITQQLAKNVFLSNERTYERKVREIFIALDLEKKYTKDQILEFYINNIYFANGYYGIEAASRGYFNKPAKDLDLAEAVFLCSIPNRPSFYNPLEHYQNTLKRKNRILKQMLDEDCISAAEYSDANYEKIVLKPAQAIKTQNYMTTYAVSCATKALMKARGFEFKYKFKNDEEKKQYDKEYDKLYDECHNSLYTGGYRIYTSLNKKKQKKLQKAVNDQLAGFKEKTKKDKVYKLQGAATCIDNSNGLVVAIVGGRKQKSITGYTLNRAYQSYRQPGSCFKPIAVYTPQLERGYTPDSIVDDTYFNGGPHNADGSYAGKISLRYAVEKSKNVIAWKLFQELTPEVGLSYPIKMGFANITDSDYYPAASLGGLTNGVTTVEMASAFATIENDGVFREPTCISKITDADGKTIVNNKNNRREKQVYKKNAARMMTSILQGVLVSGTARGNALDNMSCAGKTGTTSDKKDGWFCGYTSYYTTTVWVGYDNPKTISDLYGNTYPLRIWREFMSDIHQGLKNVEFKSYDGEKSTSSSSGYSGSYGSDGNTTATAVPTIDPDAAEADETEPTEAPVTDDGTDTGDSGDKTPPTKKPSSDNVDTGDTGDGTDSQPDDVGGGDNSNPDDVGTDDMQE